MFLYIFYKGNNFLLYKILNFDLNFSNKKIFYIYLIIIYFYIYKYYGLLLFYIKYKKISIFSKSIYNNIMYIFFLFMSFVIYPCLKEKKVFITGASGGIGRVLAQGFFNQGCHVFLSGRLEKSLIDLKEEMIKNNSEFCGSCTIVPMDLSCPQNIQETLKNIHEISSMDIFISNGGMTLDKLSLRLSDDDMAKVLQVNFQSAFSLSRHFLRSMMAKKWGRLIYISSIIGFTGNRGQANYAASKGALVAMAKSLALEYASKGITSNTIAPGYIDTPMTQIMPEDGKKAILEKIPMGFYGEPQDILNTALFLASHQSRYITGQTLHVNGGMGMF